MEAKMRAEVRKGNMTAESWTEERCYIAEVANDPGDELVSIARARVGPGVATAWHKLTGITERYLIVSGQGCVEIGDMQPVHVVGGDVVRIPADTPQRITNTGQAELVFYAVCSPRFQAGCYSSLE